MRKGNRGFMLKTLTESFTRILSLGDLSLNLQFKNLPLIFSYTYDNTTLTPKGLVNTSVNYFNQILLKYGNRFDSSGVIFNRKSTITYYLFEELNKYTPLFNFYVRKVDKNVRKNSRGKSGKYMIIWKYVPPYKRFYVTLRWLLKDLKFQKALTFSERLFKVLEIFITNPHISFLVRIRRFVHSFVFYNHKQSLLKTLKSTS